MKIAAFHKSIKGPSYELFPVGFTVKGSCFHSTLAAIRHCHHGPFGTADFVTAEHGDGKIARYSLSVCTKIAYFGHRPFHALSGACACLAGSLVTRNIFIEFARPPHSARSFRLQIRILKIY
jgi:hypothetical protein